MKLLNIFTFIVFLVISAFSHKALLLVEDNEDGTIYIEAGISTGGNATGNMIYVTEASTGKPIWQGQVPDSGNFDIEMPKVPYLVTLDMGAGHKVSKRGPFPEDRKKDESEDEALIKSSVENVKDKSAGKYVAIDLAPVKKIISPLIKNTNIQIVDILKNRATINEIEEFSKNNEEYLRKIAPSIDAFFTIRSVWPEENLFNYLRMYNIRIIECDLASPINPQFSGVGIKYKDNHPNKNIWLSFTNISKMMELAASDLSNLFPEDSIEIKKNLKEVKNIIIKERIKLENEFSVLEIIDVAVVGHLFDYILDEAGLNAVLYMNGDLLKREGSEYENLEIFGKESPKKILIHKWEPADKKISNILKKYNFDLVILDDGLNLEDSKDITQFIADNYSALIASLKK